MAGRAPGQLGKRSQTPGELIIFSLENLTQYNFKKFKNKLSDFADGDIPQGRLENADWITTKQLLIDRYGEEEALDVTTEILTEIGLRGPAQALQKRRAQNAPTKSSLPQEEQSVEPPSKADVHGIMLCSKKEYERICSEGGQQIYSSLPQEGRKRLALIICNDKFNDRKLKERDGAKFDVEGMEKLLHGLGYEVQKENNLTVQEMKETMKNFAADEKHISSDSTFLVFMSHGDRDVICGTDTCVNSNKKLENVLDVNEIFTTFNNVNCRALRDKPKVVIIQACRGKEHGLVQVKDGPCDRLSDGHENLEFDAKKLEDDAKKSEDDEKKWVQKETDCVLFCSSTTDTVSWRDPKKGSLFIQCLIEHMKKDAHRFHVLEIFCNVQKSFKNGYQMPTIERQTFLKTFFLFPGH